MTKQSFIGGITMLSTYYNQVRASLPWLAVVASVAVMPKAVMATVSGEEVLCYFDRPCINLVASNTKSIQLQWRGEETYDFYNIRWSREGEDETQTMLKGGKKGSVALTKILPNTQYRFRVQGCNTQLWGGPACTDWDVQEVTTEDFVVEEEPAEDFVINEDTFKAQPDDVQPDDTQSSDKQPVDTPDTPSTNGSTIEVQPTGSSTDAKSPETPATGATPPSKSSADLQPTNTAPPSKSSADLQPANAPAYVVPTTEIPASEMQSR